MSLTQAWCLALTTYLIVSTWDDISRFRKIGQRLTVLEQSIEPGSHLKLEFGRKP